MANLLLSLLTVGIATFLFLAIPADEARAHDDNSATLHAENYPLHESASLGDLDSVNHFLTAHAMRVNAKQSGGLYSGYTPLHCASSGFGNSDSERVAIVSVLIAAGAEVNVKNPELNTPLHFAAGSGHIAVVSVFLAAGANMNAKNADRQTPQHVAYVNGHGDIVDMLKRATERQEEVSRFAELFRKLPANERANWRRRVESDATSGNAGAKSLLAEINKRVSMPEAGRQGYDAAKIYENTWRSVVVVFAGDTQGGGVILGGPNQVATNCHVVDESPYDIRVYKGEGRQANRDEAYSAKIVSGDRKRDVCILSVSGLWGIVAKIRAAGDLEIGEAVYAVGAPQGFDFSISDGIVSQLRTMEGESAPLIQTSAAISPGSSGGGLFDSQGRLVGLTTWKIRKGENLNFAVPVDWALELQ